jgi:hypothetical protein
LIPRFDRTRWEQHLPRVRLPELIRKLGLPAIAPAPIETVRERGAGHLTQTAAAVVGFSSLLGNHPPVVRARTAAVQLGSRAAISAEELRWALDLRRQGIPEHRARAPEPEIDSAILCFMGLRTALESPRRMT